ncbi:MAG: flagellar hook-associated protein FlgK [Candidatus Poribacteria bacterium]|nr:flagellar hook-associated protein FlgK [Candidatus Poribacteria bacterium]
MALNGLGLFNSFHLGRRAAGSSQAAIGVIGRNIANVNTPGYTRQRAITGVSDTGSDQAVGQLPQIQAIRDQLTERLLLQERSRFGTLDKQAILMSQIETTFNEPSDTGLASTFDRFFDAAEQLANSPESVGAKAQLIERAKTLASTFSKMSSDFAVMRGENVEEAKVLTTEANNRLAAIGQLNVLIARAASDDEKLELQNRQERIVGELGEILNVRMMENANGTRTVSLNGLPLASAAETGTINLITGPNQDLYLQLDVSGSKFDLLPGGGSLHGLIETQNSIIPAIENDLHTTALNLVDSVNALFPNFFQPLTDPAQRAKAGFHVRVLVSMAAQVTAGSSGSGSNDLALALADLRNSTVAGTGNVSIPAFYRELVSAVGSRASELNQQRDTSELVVDQLQIRREGVSGVSLDEEAADLILYQRGFQAAAQYMSVVDELMQTIINGL